MAGAILAGFAGLGAAALIWAGAGYLFIAQNRGTPP
jgi:hypothetical protein